MIVLIDTDILLDIALNRDPFVEYSAKLIDKVEQNIIEGFIAWHTLSNFYYLIAPSSGKKKTKEFISELLNFVNVSSTHTKSAEYALSLNVPDFEDALQMSAAKECNADFIVTRNTKHYKKSPIPAVTPKELLDKIF